MSRSSYSAAVAASYAPPDKYFLRPFSSASPWNRPVASLPGVSRSATDAFASISNPLIGNWAPGSGIGTLGVNMVRARPSDPLVSLYFSASVQSNAQTYLDSNGASGWARFGNGATIDATIMSGADQLWAGNEFNQYSTATSGSIVAPPIYKHRTADYWATQARIPASALPPLDVDGHWAIEQPYTNRFLEVLSGIVMGNGDVVSHFCSFTDATGLGDGTSNGRRASMIPNYAGIIRDGELTALRIPHALALAVGPEVLGKTIVAPAVALDRGDSYTGTLAMGTFLTIPPDVDLTTLGFATGIGMAIAKAAQEFGLYIVDSTGGGNFLLCHQQNATDIPSYDGNIAADIGIVAQQVQVTTHA